MKCENCGLLYYGEPCGLFDDIGVEFPNGMLGCRLPANRIETMLKKADRHYYEEAMDTSQEYQARQRDIKIEDIIDECKHMIGLDYQNPYKRHGKAFYKPYRNYYEASPCGNKNLDAMMDDFIVRRQKSPETSVWYFLTKEGMDWLGRRIGVTIKEELK